MLHLLLRAVFAPPPLLSPRPQHKTHRKTSLQQLSIKPLPTADGSAPAEKKTAGRVLVLGKDGGVKAGTIGGEVKDVDASAVDRLLADVRRTSAKEEVVPAKGGGATVGAPAEEVGAYDLLMQELQRSATGKVGHRTKGPAEIAAESQAEFIRLQREKTRRLRGTEDDADSDEEGGGDAPHVYQPKYHDGESQEKRDSKARKQASSLFEGYMQQLENECKPGDGGGISIDFERVDTIVQQLKQLCGVSPVAACLTARGLIEVLNDLLEAEAAQTSATAASVSTSPFSLLVPAVLTKIFPPSDFRHPVMTPLSLYLSSALMQTPLRTLRDVSAGLFRAALLIDMSKDTHRYNGEVLSFLTNVLALQGASEAATPAAAAGNDYYAFLKKEGRSNPLLSECIPELPCADRAMLASGAGSDEPPSKKKRKRAEAADASQAPPLDFAASFCTADQTVADSPAVRRQLAAAAYRLLVRAVACFGVCEEGTEHLQPALAPVLETLDAVAPALHPALSVLDAQLRAALGKALEASVSGRFPLRLQAHRPIPLPLYEPKVTDFEEGEEDERRALKAQFRAEKKAAIRSLRQDAQFLNAAKEKERAYEMGKREDILNSMTAELQGQRKMIKQSDVARVWTPPLPPSLSRIFLKLQFQLHRNDHHRNTQHPHTQSKLRDMQKKAKK